MAFCGNCGTKVKEVAMFCGNCGNPLSVNAAGNAGGGSFAREKIAMITQTGWKSKRTLIIIDGAAALITVLSILGARGGTDNSERGNSAKASGGKALDKNSKTIVTATPGLIYRLSSNINISLWERRASGPSPKL